jgi:ADP-ribosylglycohydrolase
MSALSLPPDHASRLDRALVSLRGLAVGDAFGERFFVSPATVEGLIAARAVPAPPWPWTDDTAMAIGILEVLNARGRLDRDALARVFARRYRQEPDRGYGGTAHRILREMAEGKPWRDAAGEVFGGMGSMGNGGGMRAAPLGAYFADDLPALAEAARASAEVTHAHPDGQAGAVAVALAASWAWNNRGAIATSARRDLLDFVLAHTPDGDTRGGIARARALPEHASVQLAASALGTGARVISSDTVPFALWCAARHLGDYAEALWTTVSGLGDRDTTCAIVGGIVALSAGADSIPEEWLRCTEPVPALPALET